MALHFAMAAALHSPDLAVNLVELPSPPVVLYTDASGERGKTRLGAKLRITGELPRITISDPQPEDKAHWGAQETVISQAGLHAAPLSVITWARFLRRRRVLWLVDNSAANTAFVKSASPTQSMAHLSLQAHAALAGLSARVWAEHVPSEGTPADVLSRDGLSDPVVKAHVDEGRWVYDPPQNPTPLLHLDYGALWRHWAAGAPADP